MKKKRKCQQCGKELNKDSSTDLSPKSTYCDSCYYFD